ncbi:hypothetical protein Tco_0595195 [Tanacetum coccineum]
MSPQGKVIDVFGSCGLGLRLNLELCCSRLVPSCFVIFELEPLFPMLNCGLSKADTSRDDNEAFRYSTVVFPFKSQNMDHIGFPVSTNLILIESRKSPTAVLFKDNTGRISIRHCEILKSITLNVLARSQG